MTEMLRNEGLKRVRMRLITAVVFVFTLTCSGSFGMEDVISSSGPGLTLLMILILPLVWSVPMAPAIAGPGLFLCCGAWPCPAGATSPAGSSPGRR